MLAHLLKNSSVLIDFILPKLLRRTRNLEYKVTFDRILPDNEKGQNPLFVRSFGLFCPSLDWEMVEAAGIEPASEKYPLEISTGLGQVCVFPEGSPLTRHLPGSLS